VPQNDKALHFLLKHNFMKFILSIAAAAMMMISTAQAQHTSVHSALGIKGGLNIYNLETDPDNNYDSKIGFNAGLLGHVHLSENWALQPEITYSSQGAKTTVAGTDYKLNLGYINVPVLVQYMFDNGFRIEAGPQVGFLINAKAKAGSVETDAKDNFKTVDFGIGAGLSYVHPPTGFGIDARYNLGLSNINDNSSINEVKNRGAQIGVFYLFNHKH
jgi:hypothetical protein